MPGKNDATAHIIILITTEYFAQQQKEYHHHRNECAVWPEEFCLRKSLKKKKGFLDLLYTPLKVNK